MGEDMVSVLIAQHRELRRLIEEIQRQAVLATEYAGVIDLQVSFLKKLAGHLKLENDFFYPKIVSGMIQRAVSKEQQEKTVGFIAKMKDIEAQVLCFFDEYQTPESIAERKESYLSGLKEIIAVLMLRIETEEEGVYMLWDFFGDPGGTTTGEA